MSDLEAQFKQAAEDVMGLGKRPGNMTMLKLYAFYKQATVGDVQGKRPGFTNAVGRAKYDAWSKLKGNPAGKSMESYVALVNKLKAK